MLSLTTAAAVSLTAEQQISCYRNSVKARERWDRACELAPDDSGRLIRELRFMRDELRGNNIRRDYIASDDEVVKVLRPHVEYLYEKLQRSNDSYNNSNALRSIGSLALLTDIGVGRLVDKDQFISLSKTNLRSQWQSLIMEPRGSSSDYYRIMGLRETSALTGVDLAEAGITTPMLKERSRPIINDFLQIVETSNAPTLRERCKALDLLRLGGYRTVDDYFLVSSARLFESDIRNRVSGASPASRVECYLDPSEVCASLDGIAASAALHRSQSPEGILGMTRAQFDEFIDKIPLPSETLRLLFSKGAKIEVYPQYIEDRKFAGTHF